MSNDQPHGNANGAAGATVPLPDDLAARLAAALEPVSPPPNLRARVLERARQAPPPAAPAAGSLYTLRAQEGAWYDFLPRVQLKPLRAEGETLTYLLRLAPGAIVVPHVHPQDEECLVLEGEARIGELVLHAGDYHLAPAGVPHDAVRSDRGALLLLRGARPAFGQIRWGQRDTFAALVPNALRGLWER